LDWDLTHWADAQTLRRAAAYVKRGAVSQRKVSRHGPNALLIEAQVDEDGLGLASVQLRWDGQDLQATCTCPMAPPCRHAMAVAVAQMGDPVPAEPESRPQGLLPGMEVIFYNLNLAPPPKKIEKLYQRPLCAWLFLEKAIVMEDGLPGIPRPLPMWAPVNRKGLTEADGGVLDVVEPFYRIHNKAFNSTQAHGIPLIEEMVGPVFAYLARCPFVFAPGRVPLSIRPDQPIKDQGNPYEEVWEVDGAMVAGARNRLVGDAPAWILVKDAFRPLIEAPLSAVPFDAEEPPQEPPEGVPRAELPMHAALAPRGRLNLSEDGDRLIARLTFRYGAGTPVSAADTRTLVGGELNGEWGFWSRDAEAEHALAGQLAQSRLDARGIGQYLAWGDAALHFLLDELPELMNQGWEIYGEEKLEKLRVKRKSASISVGVSSGIDWFDLRTTVNVDGEAVSWAALKEAFKQNSRFVKLGSGAFARLPEEWLNLQRQLGETAGFDGEDTGDGFTQRLPVYLAPVAQEVLAVSDEQSADSDWRRLLRNLESVDGLDALEPPLGFKGELRNYQGRGLARLSFWRDHGLHGILADDMGLGKTIQAIALLLAEKSANAPHPSLLVVPTSVVYNWEQEIARFAPELKVLVLHGSQRHTRFDEVGDHDVVVTTYGLLQRDKTRLGLQPFNYVILDEAQKIKNPRSQAAKCACRLRARHRLCLTGTPIENNLLEFWSLFHFLMPGLLGSERYFRTHFLKAAPEEAAPAREHLKRLTRPFILRRLKGEVAQDLPPRTEIVAYCELGVEQRRLYDDTLSSVRGNIFAEVQRQGLKRAHFHVLEGLLRLRQVVCDPKLIWRDEEATPPPSAKVEHFLEMLRDIIAEGHRVLVFSQFVKMLHILRDGLAAEGIAHAYLDGKTKDRLERVQKFNADDTPVFLISLKAGGTGLNLTGADYVIHFDPWWNPAVEDQATDRAHRIGQTRHVFSYKLIAKDTIEEKVLGLQAKKRKMVQDILGATEADGALSMEDLEYLLT
jgi:superfamily II DNA or RNA helicase